MKNTPLILIFVLMLSALLSLRFELHANTQSTFSSQRIAEAINKYVSENTNFESVVKFEQAIKEYTFKEDEVRASISHKEKLRGASRIILTFSKNDKILSTQEIRIRVFLYAQIPIAAIFISKGDTLTHNNISLEKCDVTNLTDIITDLSEINSQIAKTGIPKGSAIKTKDLLAKNNLDKNKLYNNSNNQIAIKKNSQVKVLHYAGSILLKFNATALEDGLVGDIIKIKKDNSKTLYGFVAEDGNVILENESFFTTNKNK